MDKKSKVLIILFIITIFISIFFTYKRSFMDRDFLIIEEEVVTEEEDGVEEELIVEDEAIEEESL